MAHTNLQIVGSVEQICKFYAKLRLQDFLRSGVKEGPVERF